MAQLDKYIIGQSEGKAAVAVALRNRWRRRQLSKTLQEEVHPMNILLIGPTGSGKTEIARRLAKLADAPFVKVEATRYTEVGFYGANTDSMIKELAEESIRLETAKAREKIQKSAITNAELTVAAALSRIFPLKSKDEILASLLAGEYDKRKITVMVSPSSSSSGMMGGKMGSDGVGVIDMPTLFASSGGTVSLSSLFGGGDNGKNRKEKFTGTVKECMKRLIEAEKDSMIDPKVIKRKAILAVEQTGIVFLDEIDKLASPKERGSGFTDKGNGVQKELLSLIEGSIVATPHGSINTEHILFIASGAFSMSKPNDLLPELQGRLPIRVKLNQLYAADFQRILTETQFNLIDQQVALLETESVKLKVTACAIEEIAKLAAQLNSSNENIGARRLSTIIATVMADISFYAPSRVGAANQKGQEFHNEVVDAEYVKKSMHQVIQHVDLSKYVL